MRGLPKAPDRPEKALEYLEGAGGLSTRTRIPGSLARGLMTSSLTERSSGRRHRVAASERALRLESVAGPNEQRSRTPLMWFTWMDELEAARPRHALKTAGTRDRRGRVAGRAPRPTRERRAQCGELGGGRTDDRRGYTTLDQMGLRIGPWGMIWRIPRERRPPSRPYRPREGDVGHARRGIRTDGPVLLCGGCA